MDSYEMDDAVEEKIERIRDAALKIAQNINPEIQCVIDPHTIDDYCVKRWDYPGKWYVVGFKLPEGVHSESGLITAIAEETLRYFSKKKQ